MLTVWQKEKVTALIVALRSGGYEQGTNYLKTSDNKFCCLGVACDLIDNKRWARDFSGYTYLERTAFLPPSIKEMYGFPADDGICTKNITESHPRDSSWTLATLNDAGLTFSMIADIIEYWMENN